jgi:phosphoglycerol transferase MdoB-like AlkP superfamily enzyme
MEPEVRKFLAVIVQCISMGLLWMLLNTFFGIKLGLLFLDEKITIWHYVYYACLIASFIALVWYIRNKIKSVPKFGLDEEGN